MAGMQPESSRELSVESEYVEVAAEVFSMLADATRVRLILALREGEVPVGELAERVGKSNAAVSQHLAKLRLAHLVATRQEGNRVFYRLANPHAARLVVDALHQAAHATDAVPLGHEEPREA
jgi:DNA-binding transcriptional ArsR family regulator